METLLLRWTSGRSRPLPTEPPLRADVLNPAQLFSHGRTLAVAHQTVIQGGRNGLLTRLNENEEVLHAFHRDLLASGQMTPAAEWLLDNAFLIDEQIRNARRHLPRKYSRELPRLIADPGEAGAGLPRVYILALEYIAHVDALLDLGSLQALIGGYQEASPLKLGELWAVPIMLRLGLIENLRRVTARLSEAMADRRVAAHWALRLQKALETPGTDLAISVGELARARLPRSSAFVSEFHQHLSRLGAPAQLARNWFEQRLTDEGRSLEQYVLAESQRQAADQVSVSHSIASLRLLGALDWRTFVESLSRVDSELRQDPAGVYGRMDFATRDQYRHTVETVARHSGQTEVAVAARAVQFAAEHSRLHGREDRRAHVGYHLSDAGRTALERAVGAHGPWTAWPRRFVQAHPLGCYVGGIILITLAATAGYALAAVSAGFQGIPLGVLCAAALWGASQLAVGLLNWLAPRMVPPRLLPRLNFDSGIPRECATMVAVPTMVTGVRSVDRLLDSLEIHHLANRDPHLYLALLTDLSDADEEVLPGDAALVSRLKAGIEGLNALYGPNRFFLLHRPRRWNDGEGVWMGYERKRGKLAEFNRLLRGRGRDRFAEVVGDLDSLPEIRFVITLDTDTQLPRDAAHRLVGTLAHPLNRAAIDPASGIVTEGYGILQPRVGVSLPAAGRSWFARLFAGDPGMDPYTRSVSDVYQDLFGEGTFIGKGIYDVDAFEKALEGRFPENAILSHDLIESGYARSALVSDVELYEEYPSRYNTDSHRRHRWIRGDWQIAPWLLPRVPGSDARWIANPISAVSRWKLFDNLRRSLVAVALLVLLVGDWLLAAGPAGPGVVTVLTVLLAPVLLDLLLQALQKPSEWPLALHLRAWIALVGRHAAQSALTLAFLPYDAWVSLDAVIRTLTRLLITRRRLLEWQTSSDADLRVRSDLQAFVASMWAAPLSAVAIATALLVWRPEQIGSAAPFLVSWMIAPVLGWWISRPLPEVPSGLSDDQRAFLRQAARRTWAFFETWVGPADHWLPPDNFQEVPRPVVASRTSPTNLGLGLLAELTAHDLGYLSLTRLVQRISRTLETMERLERHRGHFYNWYDTRTLQPLPPLYLSTVDSGNLAGHLLTLAAGLQELCERSPYRPMLFAGLRDTLELARRSGSANRSWSPLFALFESPPDTPQAAAERLGQIRQEAARMDLGALRDSPEAREWFDRFQSQCQDHAAELQMLFAPSNSTETSAGHPSEAAGEEHPVVHSLRRLAGAPTDTQTHSDSGTAAPATAQELLRQLEDLARRSQRFAAMDFAFLFDAQRKLFTIGYNVAEHRRDAGFYDLLASEARLASFVAISQGQVPQDHWFALGRLMGNAGGGPALMSWSGSMFEYLMPLLVMPSYEGTLLDHTGRAAVEAQIRYGRSRGVPWGISESGFNVTDAQGNYQYRAFGVPGLGLKRGLADDLVVAPYASMMALMVAPRAACENLERLALEGRTGRFGFHEAVDYTPARLPADQTSATIRSFMAHHQGMGLIAMASALLHRPMQRRFLAVPSFRATELLLQERMPRAVAISASDEEEQRPAGTSASEAALRVYNTPHTPHPQVHLLSNGRYHVMVSQAGGGYSRWGDLALTRWREDPACDGWGSFCYVRDVESDEVWSAAFQPLRRLGERYEAIFTQGRAEFRQRYGDLELHTEIGVSPEDDLELRRLSLINHRQTVRTMEVTTYLEVVLAPAAADAAHPAFSNLFVETEFDPETQALLCTRRARTDSETPPWMVHAVHVPEAAGGTVAYETDRVRFLGRGQTPQAPASLRRPLSGSVGAVLDPILALRRTVRLGPGETLRMDQVTGIAPDRQAALALAGKYAQHHAADRLFDLAWTQSQVVLRQLDCTLTQAQDFGILAGALVYANPARRAGTGMLLGNRRGQSSLWSYGISGDVPIVLLTLTGDSRMDLVRSAVLAHAYWRVNGLTVELVILHEETSVYRQSLQEQIVGLISSGLERPLMEKPGGVFVRRLDQVPPEDRLLLQAVARIVLSDESGPLSEQVKGGRRLPAMPPPLLPTRPRLPDPPQLAEEHGLAFFNGLGGFTPDGREYVITLAGGLAPVEPGAGRRPALPPWLRGRRPEAPVGLGRPMVEGVSTPAPWVNVLANPFFGTVISESGGTYTWLENSHEFRLTPWHNDPVSDVPGEALYVRDEETGEFWSATPLPARGTTPYTVRHGFGYTVFEHLEQGVIAELHVYVAPEAPVKFSRLRIRNVSGRPRRLSVTAYWEWVLGQSRTHTALHVQTQLDARTGALLARNHYNAEFSDRVAFADVDDPARTVTGDRREFLGSNGTLARPAALGRLGLSGRVGAGLDPCAALQVVLEIPAGGEREVVFRLGAGRSLAEVQYLIQRFRRPNAGSETLEAVRAAWDKTLGTLEITTPDPALNLLANGWLVYQTLGARLWGRTGFYQSGGAFGFRDQLQDAMGLTQVDPSLLRDQLLRAAARQFEEGDVQHWWHPPGGRGVRTRISDDYLWLPFALCHYLRVTEDTGVLDEMVPYLQGRPVKAGEEGYYDLPNRAEREGTLYEHCARAVENGLRLGTHGLPLIGTGDWNDGFNLVGAHGRGESVWLGFFLITVLEQFAAVARRRGDAGPADRYLEAAARLRENLERHAWDGRWYLRAWFDDGTPLGSHTNAQCRLDSLPQSWAVLSGAGDKDRSAQAMQSVLDQLVSNEGRLIRLFTPPFDEPVVNPGYIKGYLPGVRENGGQYTHAAIWTVMALLELGWTDTAWDLMRMINPVSHGSTPEDIAIYKVEPYVMAADVYAAAGHLGRGGWTWYTGSAGWMYRLITESLLGLHREGERLRLRPRLPSLWPGFQAVYRYRDSRYHIQVTRVPGDHRIQLRLDGSDIEGDSVPLTNDGRDHHVVARVGIPDPKTPSPPETVPIPLQETRAMPAASMEGHAIPG